MKKIIILSLLFLLSLSFVNAQIFNLDESRTRIAYNPSGDNDEILYSGFSDVYLLKSGSFTYTRADNNFTSFVVTASTTITDNNFASFLYDNSIFIGATSFPSTVFNFFNTSIIASEINIFGVNAFSIGSSFELNDVTPLPYIMSGTDGGHYDQQTDLLYVMHNDSTQINVYQVSKPNATYDYSYVRNFNLSKDCGYTSTRKVDISILNNQLYLLCGDKTQVIDRTVYAFTLLGDLLNEYKLLTLDNNYNSLTFSQATNEMILYDNTNNEIVFFNFSPSITQNGSVVVVDGQAYNTTNLCINDNQVSNNSSVSVDQFGNIIFNSDEQYISWCSGGCVNINDTNNIAQGVCSSLACINECSTPNLQNCETPNTYSLCSVGIDNCLDLNSGLFCPASTGCIDTLNGAQCEALNETTFTQPFISIDLEVNNTDVFEVIKTDVDRTINIVTTPILTTFGVGLQQIAGYFLKSVAKTVTQEIKISGISNLQPSTYYALSCDFKEKVLEEDYLNVINDITSNNTIISSNNLFYLDINTTTIKTLEPTQIGQQIEYIIKPLNTGTNFISFKSGGNELLELAIIYNKTTKNLIIKDTFFNKIIVNETDINVNDSLQEIVITNLFIKEASVNNIEITINREINNIPTSQKYYSLPIAYYSIGNSPSSITFYNDDNSTLRLYQIVQREQSGYTPFSTNEIGTCEYTSLTCTNQRAWVNDRVSLSYYFKEDIQTCINELGGVISGDPNTVSAVEGERDLLETFFATDFSQGTKFTIATLSLLIIFGLFYYVYIETKEKLLLVVGSITTIATLFIFAFFGYLPVWLLILIGAVTFWVIARGRG